MSPSAGEDVEKVDHSHILDRMQNGKAILENSVVVSFRTQYAMTASARDVAQLSDSGWPYEL